jgi:hypothetical protein
VEFHEKILHVTEVEPAVGKHFIFGAFNVDLEKIDTLFF